MRIKPARLPNMHCIEAPKERDIFSRRREHRDAEVEALKEAVAVLMTNDAISGRSVESPQMADVHAFSSQRGSYDIARGIASDCTDIGSRSATPSRIDCNVDAVAARVHFPTRPVAVDDIVAHGRDFQQCICVS